LSTFLESQQTPFTSTLMFPYVDVSGTLYNMSFSSLINFFFCSGHPFRFSSLPPELIGRREEKLSGVGLTYINLNVCIYDHLFLFVFRRLATAQPHVPFPHAIPASPTALTKR